MRCILIATLCAACAAANAGEPVKQDVPVVGGSGKALKIATVDISVVFAGYTRALDLTKQGEAKLKDSVDKLQARATKLAQTDRELKSTMFSRTDPQFVKMKAQHDADKKEFLADKEKLLRTYRAIQMGNLQRLSADVIEAIRLHAEAEGFDLILKKRLDRSPGTTANYIEALQVNSVLYNSSVADVSAAIVKRLNEAYKEGKPLGAPLIDDLRKEIEAAKRQAGGARPATPPKADPGPLGGLGKE